MTETTEHGFALFDTAIGRCGIAWNGHGISALHLPEARDAVTRARLIDRFPDAREARPPSAVQKALDLIVTLLRGEASELAEIPLDMRSVPPFHRRVYELVRTIPPGTTLSYGEVATKLGAEGAARAVGQAMRRNPFAILVPCHRVFGAGGKVGGYSANGGIATKLRLLALETAPLNAAEAQFEGDGAFGFDPVFALEHLRAADPVLARLIDEIGPFRMRLKQTASLFAALAEAIVYQQLNGKAAAAIFARVRALFPRAHQGLTPQQILRVSDAKLRGAGLSQSKLLALRDLAKKAADGTIPTLAEAHKLDDETIIARLTEVRGIGRWTAEMLLIFRLGRADVLPVDDFGVRQGFAYAFKKRAQPTPQALAEYGKRWAPYRSVASWYLWRGADLATKAKVKAKPRASARKGAAKLPRSRP